MEKSDLIEDLDQTANYDVVWKNQRNAFEHYNKDLKKHINAQTFWLRKAFSMFVICLLVIQVGFLIGLIVFQAWHIKGFNLNNCVFSIFSSGCLIETFFLTKSIVNHIFPLDPSKTSWFFSE
ncbi:MAG: hypothetical protein QM752_08345 [Gammaproteobacteria bacterium]